MTGVGRRARLPWRALLVIGASTVLLAIGAVLPAGAVTPGCGSGLPTGPAGQCSLSIYGTVTYQDSTPAANARVSDGAGNSTVTDAQGSYEFGELAPGNYRISATAPPPNFMCRAVTVASYNPVLSAATGGTRADVQLPCTLPPPVAQQWMGPPHQVLVTTGPGGHEIGLTVGGGCLTITVDGKFQGSACGSPPDQLGPEQWFPILGTQIPGGWADGVQVGANAASIDGVAGDGTRSSGVISIDGWGLVAGAAPYLNPEVYDYEGNPMQSAKPTS